jgi:phthalate 4,5-dioxygenase
LVARDAQREGRLFSGISNLGMQDQAANESMGEITDRAREQLRPSDLMVVRTRRRLLRVARELASAGSVPPGHW